MFWYKSLPTLGFVSLITLDRVWQGSISGRMVHFKCRCVYYPRVQNVKRIVVPDDKVPWSVTWPEYAPPEFTDKSVISKPWADPDIGHPNFNPKWNSLDGNVNRKSHMGAYDIKDGYPLNPEGRTGLARQGCLGRWGPNHAADPIVTRWKRDSVSKNIVKHQNSGLPVLQFVAIARRDNGEWAIPGGMVDPGEVVTSTLQREFMEEALNILESTDMEKSQIESMIQHFFKEGVEVYRGYVDDPRNTDNSWMETIAMNFHDNSGETLGALKLCAGDDAAKVRWMDVGSELKLYASHLDFIKKVASMHSAHW